MVLNKDCAEITEVKISLGTLSATAPVSIGFLMFSIKYIPANASREIIQMPYIKDTPLIIPATNPVSNVIYEMFTRLIAATFDEYFDARDVARKIKK